MSDSPTRSAAPDGEPTADPPAPLTVPEPELPTTAHFIEPLGTARPLAPPGYELFEQVGRGGMGAVYRAREVAFDRDVAVKLLQDRYGADSGAVRRFLEEARITGQLQHPAIPPVHALGALPDGRPFLAMKLIKGDTLADLLEREPAARGRYVVVFEQVCQGVAFAHSRRVIHRDLKPANVMVGKFGEVQVMDWGLAKLLPSDGQPPLAPEETDGTTEIRTRRGSDDATQSGAVLGTPAFMAPEQAQGAVGEVDERADVFGLGAVLCVILTGQPPYTGPSTESVRLKAVRGETADCFARLDTCGADTELVALCKRCLAREREDRPRTADEVAKAVSAHLTAAEERARRAELDTVRIREVQKRNRVQIALAGAVVLLLTLTAFGAALASLWRSAKGAKEQLEVANVQLKDENRETDGARAEAERGRERLAAFEYGRTIQVAHQEWRDNKIAAARALLDGTDPKLRGWEWHYVDRLCDSALLTFKENTNFVAFSPDGGQILTAGGDDTAKVRDARTGAERLTLKGHTREVSFASFSPDGTRIVTTSNDNTAKVWDAKTGAVVLTFQGHTSSVHSAVFSPDGAQILTASDDYTAKVWDARTGAVVITLKWFGRSVRSAVFSPNGTRIVTGTYSSNGSASGLALLGSRDDDTARMWDAETGTKMFSFQGRVGHVGPNAFSPDGTRAVTTRGRTARVWDARTGVEVLTLKGHAGSVRWAAFGPNGARIVTASDDNAVKVWDAQSGVEVLTLRGHTQEVHAACFSPDGARIATAGRDGTVKVWDARADAEAFVLDCPTDLIFAMALSPDGSLAATAGQWGVAKVRDVRRGTERHTLIAKGTIGFTGVSFAPDGTRLVTTSDDGGAQVWDTKTGTEQLTFGGGSDASYAPSFSPDGTRIVTAGDKVVRIWDAHTGAEVLTLKDCKSTPLFSPDGARVVAVDENGTPKVWDAKTGAEQLTFKERAARVLTVQRVPDGERIITAGDDHTAKVWDAKTGAELLTLKGHTARISVASFSPDGTRIVTGGDLTVRMWDVRTGAEVLTLKGHAGATAAVFSSDGTQLAVAGYWEEVVVWDRRLLRDSRPPDPVRQLAPPPRPK